MAQGAQHVAHELHAVFHLGQRALDAQLLVARELDVLVLLDELDDAHRLDRRVRLEADVGDAGRGIDLGHAVGRAEHAQAVHVDERLRLRWRLAKAVDDLLEQGVHLVGVAGGGELFVEAQAQVHVAAVVIGQQGGGVQVDVGGDGERRQQVGLAAGLQRFHRL